MENTLENALQIIRGHEARVKGNFIWKSKFLAKIAEHGLKRERPTRTRFAGTVLSVLETKTP
jgi:hypothetical protein